MGGEGWRGCFYSGGTIGESVDLTAPPAAHRRNYGGGRLRDAGVSTCAAPSPVFALHRDFSVCGRERPTEVAVRQRRGAHIHASKHKLKLKLAYKAKVRNNKQKNNLSITVSASVF